MVYYATQHLKAWSGAQPSYFDCKAIANFFRATEGRRTTVSCSFMPQLLQTEPLESEKYLPKWPLLSWGLSIVRTL